MSTVHWANLRALGGLLAIAIYMAAGCNPVPRADITIGFVADLTGPIAQYGNWAKNGVDLAASKINADSIAAPHLRIVTEDARSDPKAAASAAEKLISVDKVQVIVIATASSAVMAVAPVCNRNHVVIFSPTASSGNITEAGDFVFRNHCCPVKMRTIPVGWSMRREPSSRRPPKTAMKWAFSRRGSG